MKEATGGIFTIQIILVFVVIISGYLAFSVNYNRAFHIKNRTINLIESFEGVTSDPATICRRLEEYVAAVGYTASGVDCSREGTGQVLDCGDNLGICVTRRSSTAASASPGEVGMNRAEYDVVTFISIDLPIIRDIFQNVRFFQVRGTTRTILQR